MNYRKINIGLVGFGNIGSYFYKILEKNKYNILKKTGKLPVIKFISAKNIKKNRKVKLPKSKWVKNPFKITKNKEINIIVELIGGADGYAKKVVFESLKNKKHVITANKALMAKHGDDLAKLGAKVIDGIA